MEMLVLSINFCTYSRNTKLPNFDPPQKIQTSKTLGNFQQMKKYIQNVWIMFKPMEKVHQGLVFVVLSVRHLHKIFLMLLLFFWKGEVPE